ncbi:MAG: HAMP domain-containing sensor histidine kinase [Lachnospiraceae bacterium]|nr:HAMP domain-containing sensor histidine kinase [Lachnospiraceae bacterium]
MKLRSRLVIAFVIILMVPIGLVYLCITVLNGYQVRLLHQAYGVQAPDSSLFDSNTIELFDALLEKSEKAVWEAIEEDKNQFQDIKFLESLSKEISGWYSYLAVRVDDEFLYFDKDASLPFELLSQLPGYGAQESDGELNAYTGRATNCLMRQNDFRLSDGGRCTVFVITPIEKPPQLRGVYVKLAVSVVIIMLFTALLLIMWIYGSILIPIGKLKKATQAIRDGNLDYELQIQGDDEISGLCMDFEEMRRRLKANSQEKMHYDEDNKELISNISHDLKTPITAIKGYVEGIMDGVASSPDKLDKYIRTIYNKANDMDKLIDELTFYSKIDTNKIPYNFARINVSAYFEDCSEELMLDLEGQGIEMQYMNFCDTDVEVIADAEQMKRVVNNIIGNSVKYMDKKKGIINMRIKDLGDFVQVEIEDNGKGIAAKDLPYIFDRFYRTDKARNSRKGGSGIGLSIVHKIIEDHGGQIWATSKEGTGTVMHFALRKYQEVRSE